MVVVTLVLGLLLGGVFPVQADTGVTSTQPSLPLKPDWGKGRWALGKVEVIRGEVTGKGGNYIEVDGETTIYVEEGKTKFRVPTLGKEASLDDIQMGVRVVALVYKEDDTLHARHIVVIPGKPQFRHHVGIVVDYDNETTVTPERSITIEDRQGNTTTFKILDSLEVLPPGATVDVGDWVTVISHRDPASDQFIATGVVVHSAKLWLGLESVSGTITALDEAGKTITIDTTPAISYDVQTIFVLRGILALAVEEGQNATVLYREQDGTRLAKVVLVGIDLPGLRAELGKDGLEG